MYTHIRRDAYIYICVCEIEPLFYVMFEGRLLEPGWWKPPVEECIFFHFNRGARILVVGANGAGKSTLLSILGAETSMKLSGCRRKADDSQRQSKCDEKGLLQRPWGLTTYYVLRRLVADQVLHAA